MATIKLTNATYYRNGVSGATSVVGYESTYNRVVRYNLTPPDTGASRVALKFTGISQGNGTMPTTLRFYIGTDPNSHANAGSGYTYTGTLTRETILGLYTFSGSADVIINPNTTYYVWVFPSTTTFGWLAWPGDTGTAETSGGSYSTPTLSVKSVVMENPITIYTNRHSTSFTHKLTYSFGGATGTIAEGVVDSYEWTPSLELAREIPNDPSGVCTISCETYNGGTLIGTAQAVTFTLIVPDNEDTKPHVSMDISLVCDHPFDGVCVQNLTKVSAEMVVDGKYGASIKSQQMVIGGSVYEDPFLSGYLTQTGETAVTGKATDSREYVGKTEQTITVIPYAKPMLIPADSETDIVCCRCDGTGNITDSGTWLKIKAKRYYSPVVSDGVQRNFCSIRYRINGSGWNTILYGNETEDEVDVEIPNGVADTTKAYTIEVGVVDDMGYEASVTIIVPSDQVEFHLRQGGDGAAFGEYAQEAKVLSVAESWELKVKGKLTVGGMELVELFKEINLELNYPIGKLYISEDDADPGTFLGGTWERVEDTFLLAAGSTYAAGSTGGESTHTLTVNEIPSHKGHLYDNGEAGTWSSAGENTYFINKAKLEQYGTNRPFVVRNDNELVMRGFSRGGGAAHNNMPPYLAVYVWRRIA